MQKMEWFRLTTGIACPIILSSVHGEPQEKEMKISQDMNLDQLMERMGEYANRADASVLRDSLVDRFDGMDTADVPENDWADLMEGACS